MRACLGPMGRAAMASPRGVKTPTSPSSPKAPKCPRPAFSAAFSEPAGAPPLGRSAPRMASVRCARRSAPGSGGVRNGNRAILSMPIARICSTTPSTGTCEMAGGACGSSSFTKCAEENSR